MTHKTETIIIGGGAAGFFAAIHKKKTHPLEKVIIIEKSASVLSKVKISGGGRCNVTHACFDPKTLCAYYPRGAKELQGPFHQFQPKDTIKWFESHGVKLKIESDNRIFPVSNSSQEIIDCLINTATSLGIEIWTHCPVQTIEFSQSKFHLTMNKNTKKSCNTLILATGSNPKGYTFAQKLGHTIAPPIPSLFTVKINDKNLHVLSGLSVKECAVWLPKKTKEKQFGPILITHWGMSGPSIIKLSAWNAIELQQLNYQTPIYINWLNNFSDQTIKTHLSQFQQHYPKKQLLTQSPFKEIPRRLWEYLVLKSSLNSSHTWKITSQKQINTLIKELTQGIFQITGKSAFKEEFVTCGGVKCNEINFKTMESKKCKNLYIIGELLNIDGITGGFNFQQAWTTGYIAGT